MPDARIFDGPAGEHWLNGTGRPAWQLHCSLLFTCGYCLPFHLQISTRPWPVPFHGHCRCYQYLLKPDVTGDAFADHAGILANLPPDQQAVAVGRSNYRLARAGVIGFDDIAEPGRIRSATEVIARLRIPLRILIASGIPAAVADRLYREAKGSSGRDWEADHRDRLRDRLKDARAHHDAVTAHLERAIAGRSAIPAVPISEDAAAQRRRHAAELRALLVLPPGRREEPLTDAERAIVGRELGAHAVRSVAAFVAEVAGGLAAGRAYGDEIRAIYRKYAGR